MLSLQLLAWTPLLVASSAFPSTPSALLNRDANSSSTVLPPSQDPFYTAPRGFESTAPGTALRVRVAPGNLTTIYNSSASAYNILYRTTDSQYQPAWAVTTLFVPANIANSSTDALLSYQIPYNTADPDASPSYILHSDAFANGLILSDINTALDHGWYVNVPDHEGPTAAFGTGVQEGHATLDSIRAALSSSHSANLTLPTPLSQNTTRIALWGYSGGSVASEWAAELQVQYAPELTIAGVALGGLIPNLTNLILAVDGTPAAGLIPALLLGLTNQSAAASTQLLSSLAPENATAFLAARTLDVGGLFATYTNQSILTSSYLRPNASGTTNALLTSPAIQTQLNTNGQMGYHGTPQAPLFVYKAVADEYSPTRDTDALVARYCAAGARVVYQRNRLGNHLDEETNGDAAALRWLASVLDGDDGSDGSTPPALEDGHVDSTAAAAVAACTLQDVSVGLSVHEPFYLPPRISKG